MGIFDDLKRLVDGSGTTPRVAAPSASLGQTRSLGELTVTLESFRDPHRTDVRNGHCSEAFLRGETRLLAVELRLRHAGKTVEAVKIGGHKVHLFDDDDYQHTPLGLDSRSRRPRLVEGFVMPGGAARGWVTFELPLARQAKRLQLFTGYLGAGVCCFDLPVRDTEAHAAWLAEQSLVERRHEVDLLEHKAAVAEAVLARAEEVRALESRARAAQQTLARWAALERRVAYEE